MMGFVGAAVLILLVFVLMPLRFGWAVRRSLTDPRFRNLCILVIATLATGTLFYRQIEGWSLLDAFYFSAITLTTVGYGDLAPSTPAGKLFTVFYIFAGLGIVIGFVNAVARTSVEQGTREGRGLLMRRPRRREPDEEGPADEERS